MPQTWLTALLLLIAWPSLLAHAAGTSPVIISQVYGGGGNSGAPLNSDFIELHNVSNAAVSLAGYSVQYAPAGLSSAWSATPLTGSIPAGGYYLIQEAGGANGVALPTPEVTGTIVLAAGAGKVALVNSTATLTPTTGGCPALTTVVDLVGYGSTASCFEGATPTAAPSATLSVSRKDVCVDSDNNGADFATGAPTPHNRTKTADYVYCVTAVGGFSPTFGQVGTVVTITGGKLDAITGATFAGVAATNVTATANSVTATVAPGTPVGAADVVLLAGTTPYAAGTFTVTTSSISTPTLSASTTCAGSSLDVSFTASGTYGAANQFTVQLSDATGTFPATPTVIGSVANALTTAQTITATIPSTTAGSTAYRLRVVASTPATVSPATAGLTVSSVRIAPTAAQSIYTTTSGTALTATEVGTPTGRQWAYSTSSGGPYTTDLTGQTGSTYTPAFSTAGTYYVVVKSTFACGQLVSNEVVVTVSVAQAPTITSFTPGSGPAGTSVTLTGTNFLAGTTVSFNGTPAAQITLLSATQLRAVVPSGVTDGPVSVTTAGGTATSTSSFTVSARTLVLLDDFNRADNATVGPEWVETETGPAGASVASNQLRLATTTTTGTDYVSGREYVARNVSARYSPELNSNNQVLTWAWNMQQSRANPSGFDPTSYGVAFVLAGSTSNPATGTGYAVVLGGTGATDPIRLVRYSNGLNSNSVLTDIVSGGTGFNNNFLTLRVTYLPDEDTWTLEAASSPTAFQDPGAPSTAFTTLGSADDATYTGTSLPYIGCLWNHATAATDYALFDNIYLTAPCVAEADPTAGPTAAQASQLTRSSAQLSWSAGTGNSRLVLVRPSSAAAAAPVDGTTYASAPAYGQGGSVSTGTYAVYSGTQSTVTVTGLAANTTYSYSIYEATGAGCSLNYLQASPATGTFTTLPCVPATAPTLPASAAQVTATSSTSLDVSWQNGNGSQRLVVVQAGQTPATLPQEGTTYRASARLGAGAALGTGAYVVYNGAGNAVTVTGLVANTSYYVAVYEFNGTDCAIAYLGSAATAEATTLPPPVAGNYRFYRGNLHGHSSYSDGNKDASTSGAYTPADDYALARIAQQFDFMGISEHNHSQAGMKLANYAKGLAQADQATVDGTFVALYGMEYGTISGGGHVIIYNYNQLIGWEPTFYDVFSEKGNYTNMFALVAQQPGAIAYLAHPQATDYNNLLSAPLNATTAQVLVGSAMRSGPAFSTNTTYSNPSSSTYEARFRDALKQGYHVAPTIDHDTHYSVFGRSTPGRLVVLATSLTRPALYDALQQRRFYASDDFNAEVTFQVAGQPMGSVLTQAGSPTLTLNVVDPDPNDAVSSIALFAGIPGSGTAAIQLTSRSGSSTLAFPDDIPDQATYYYYAVITQADGDKIWTAPIRYTRNDALSAPLPVQLVRFQAVLQNESEAVLRWSTASEQHSAYFAVERSLDGRAFVEIGRVAAAGTSQLAHNYELRDPRALAGLTYYRLRQVDTDQTATYSPVVTLTPTAREAAEVHVYPNPSAGTASTRIALRGLTNQPINVRVTDILGRTVSTQQLIPMGYQADVPLNLPATLTPGVYSVSLSANGQTWTTRLILEP
ncbi:lamin tail domain-containing protein [Hymenobacter ginkgonis]|uniref:lamin tail domain-containing protein n=1 Tax=Hymenobacter ginkgonis TaxID=2682976 RepID=UPI0018DDE38C|nr:lamin tail domain-containing protein [Hymenobacter ginkgonis]